MRNHDAARGVSLKELLSEKKTEENQDTKKNLPKEEFSLEQIQSLWQSLLDELEKEGHTHILGAIRSTDVQHSKPQEITLLFHSNAAKAEFDKLKTDWLAKVQKAVQNYHIELNLKVEVTDSNQPNIRMPEDKFADMVEKNPLLQKLKDEFGLEFYS